MRVIYLNPESVEWKSQRVVARTDSMTRCGTNQTNVSGITHHLRLLRAYARRVENTSDVTDQ